MNQSIGGNGSARNWRLETLEPATVTVSLSEAAKLEARAFIEAQDLGNVEGISVSRGQLPEVCEALDRCRALMDDGPGFCLLQPVGGLEPLQIQAFFWVISNLLGEPLVQNSEGSRLIHIYDRDRTVRMKDGGRYHQTREGGDVHTDNVNMPEFWEYLLVGCVEPALVGGENVILSGHAVHEYLKRHVPEALRVLQSDYWWEYRGISDKLYKAPVITYDADGEPLFRYLRTYLESAHKRAEEPMSEMQVWALDVLDAVLDMADLRLRHRLSSGEALICYDSRIFHARTCFSDYLESVSIDDLRQGGSGKLRRTLERTWIRCADL